jgi:hypothetical protein
MPLAKSGSGVGQLATFIPSGNINDIYIQLPAGGTWAYYYWEMDSFIEMTFAEQHTGVAAGGTKFYTAGLVAGWCWRIS